MAASEKDIIYIDIDDEITAVIEKVCDSGAKVVALVLPKRASTFQSIVNMKLLKRAAADAHKNLVLVTTEAGLLPLAGAVGVHVAKTPNSKPEVPPAPSSQASKEVDVDEESADMADAEVSKKTDGHRSVGELSGAAAIAAPAAKAAAEETVEFNNAPVKPKPAAPVRPKAKKDKKLAIPDFNKFKALIVVGVIALIALIGFGYVALAVLPKATITVKTNASTINTNIAATFDSNAVSVSESDNVIPSEIASVTRTFTGNAQATGQQNNGEVAEGEVTFSSACSNGVQTIPAGTGISTGGNTYITQDRVSLTSASGGGGNCRLSGTTDITAQAAGAKFNTENNASFDVSSAGSNSYDASSLRAIGQADGGTDDIQAVISQADIDSARGQIDTSEANAQSQLTSELSSKGLLAIAATYQTSEPTESSSAQAGDTASSVTITQEITYSMFGVKQADVATLVDQDISAQIDTEAQNILSRGITQAAFKLRDFSSEVAQVTIQTTATVGPDLNVDQITSEVAGKKANQIRSEIGSNPDVTDVQVDLSPFWVSKAPSNTEKITVTIAKPQNGN